MTSIEIFIHLPDTGHAPHYGMRSGDASNLHDWLLGLHCGSLYKLHRQLYSRCTRNPAPDAEGIWLLPEHAMPGTDTDIVCSCCPERLHIQRISTHESHPWPVGTQPDLLAVVDGGAATLHGNTAGTVLIDLDNIRAGDPGPMLRNTPALRQLASAAGVERYVQWI